MWTGLSLSVLTAIFPGGPGLAGTRMSPFWILLELRVMEVVVTTAAIRRAKLQSNRRHQQTNTHFFLQAGCRSCCPTNSVRAAKLFSLCWFISWWRRRSWVWLNTRPPCASVPRAAVRHVSPRSRASCAGSCAAVRAPAGRAAPVSAAPLPASGAPLPPAAASPSRSGGTALPPVRVLVFPPPPESSPSAPHQTDRLAELIPPTSLCFHLCPSVNRITQITTDQIFMKSVEWLT